MEKLTGVNTSLNEAEYCMTWRKTKGSPMPWKKNKNSIGGVKQKEDTGH